MTEESGIYHWINHSWSFSPYVSLLTQKINDAAWEKGGFDCEPLVACLVWKGGRCFLKMPFWHPKSVTHLLPQLRWRGSLLQQRTISFPKGKGGCPLNSCNSLKYISVHLKNILWMKWKVPTNYFFCMNWFILLGFLCSHIILGGKPSYPRLFWISDRITFNGGLILLAVP